MATGPAASSADRRAADAARIRRARPDDAAAVADICLRTAASGADATGVLSDDGLWADLFALPYLELEPDLAWVVDDGSAVQGYLVGTADSARFARRFRELWLPRVAGRYPPGERSTPLETALVAMLHHPEHDLLPELEAYPAHLHIDLLPSAQGHGWGRRLMATFFAELRDRGVGAVHLSMAADNHRALAFYRHLGLRVLDVGRGTFLGAATDLLG
ncbi:MAG: GNAT family N-acetyltransferase [Actinomycetales bacterium]|nr:GNAT family N-acetyltransferase [Actinomycetales bacterium]